MAKSKDIKEELDEILEHNTTFQSEMDGHKYWYTSGDTQMPTVEAILNLITNTLRAVEMPENPRLIDRGNEAYYDQAEGFRMGYTLAHSRFQQSIDKAIKEIKGE